MIVQRLDEVTAQYPDAVAVVDGPLALTYRDLAARRAAIARRLREVPGIGPGDLVATTMPNSWEFIVSFFAVAEIGAIFLPLNTHWRPGEIGQIASRLPIAAMINADVVAGEADVPHRRPRPADETVLYLTTSGSTGSPKIVPRSQRNLLAGARNVARALEIRPGMRFLGVVPFHHANGFSNSMFLPLMQGGTVVVMRKFSPGKLVDVVRRERVQVLNASPFVFRMTAQHGADPGALATVEICLSTGAPLPREVAELCAERLGLRVRQHYGSTETGSISIQPSDSAGKESVGRPLESVEVRILSGEITVRSPAVMKGYVGEPELNQAAFVDGFFRTGDLGRIDEHGDLIITGRTKRMINAGGIKIDPAEIENVLMEMPAVRGCRVAGIADDRQTELIRAVIAVEDGRSVSRAGVIEHCRRHLAEYKIPRVIEFVEAMPVDATGKTPLSWEGVNHEFSGGQAEETETKRRHAAAGARDQSVG